MTASFLSRKWHKWLFLVIGVQMFLWALSGFYMVTISIDYIHGDHLVNIDKPQTSDQSSYSVNISDLIRTFPTATKIETGSLLNNPVYEIETSNGIHLVDARNGQKLSPLPETAILTIAQNLYAGPGPILSIRLLTDNPPL